MALRGKFIGRRRPCVALDGLTKERGALEDIWDESAAVPFWGRVEQLQKLSEIVSRCLDTVLETWLVLDYAVRDLVQRARSPRREILWSNDK